MTEEVANLERQVERGTVRTQSLLNRSFERIRQLEATLDGLVALLVSRGTLSEREVREAAGHAGERVDARSDASPHTVVLRAEEVANEPHEEVFVDCAARMHVCHAVCCKLSVALSGAEVEAGKVRWDLGRPYFLRREADGACTHNDRSTGGCTVYADRPQPCRKYSCATDGRIWKDFDRMELNTEWLGAHFKPDEPVFVHLDPPGSFRPRA
jgi:Fe-S-cluster containining protein